MSKSKNIYLLYSCDAWKSWVSMNLIMVSTSEKRMRKEVISQILNKKMDFHGYEEDLKKMDLMDIDRVLEYGYITIAEDGEKY